VKARVSPTRSELLRSRRLLQRVDKGAALLRRKREALVRELFPLARPAVEARRAIAEAADHAYRAELAAVAIHGTGDLEATAWPGREVEVELELARVWGVTVPKISKVPALRRGLAARGTSPQEVGPALFEATNEFEDLSEKLLDAASRELHLRALGAALARTSRQVQTLEHRVAPKLQKRITRVARALDEREREEHTRLRQLRKRRR
jgi:H(+)-transporting ATP synthase subunit D